MSKKMLREISNDSLTPKKTDTESSSDFYERLHDVDDDGLGSEENYFWKTAKERSEFGDIGIGNTALDGLG